MFEKEAEEYSKETFCGEVFHTARNAFKDGAEFGYNKANEWHKVSDKLPEMDVLVYLWNKVDDFPIVACRHKECGKIDWYWDCNQGDYYMSRLVSIDDGYLWKEIVLPELKEK